jgi:hypothetical protein
VDSERKPSTCTSDILVVDWLSTQPCVACCFSTVSRRPRLLGGQFSSPIAYLPILSRQLNKYKKPGMEKTPRTNFWFPW